MSINLLNSTRLCEVNSSIVEWDVKRAGLNITKNFSLLSDKKIEELEKMEKMECDIAIGKLQIKDREFSKNLEQKFTDVMNAFLEANDIDKDLDVISIKKDACFTINKNVTKFKFGNYIEFVPKNEYHAYLYIKPFEIYFKRDNTIDIKGLTSDKNTRNKILDIHKDGIVNLLQTIINLAESTNMNKYKINSFLHRFVNMYKRKELDYDFYREFNIESRFRYQFLGNETMVDNIDDSMLEKVNIEYNYTKIILPLINILC